MLETEGGRVSRVKVLHNEHLNYLLIENTSGVPRDRIKRRGGEREAWCVASKQGGCPGASRLMTIQSPASWTLLE
jgi:hypothetical protein